ncbi:hypothetical protein GTGU_04485 [Trabulsiella guamensis ATCC 49490]|uniref:Lipoprotein n=1 Tax=Trabulsiella guamensis ATCC 49490 TaxID=1005994 RepID=A0A084ZLR9_9ENTR|nr:hypothetical protein [Trabulsiella guamensis]KFB98413.1 hypothetical protein GTGU_04485 [Trabulsiella guamensis ATCC 49490]
MKKVLMLMALVLLAGCKPGAEKAIELAKKEIADDVRDPDSVKFRYVRFVQDEKSDAKSVSGFVCGQVNAKNGFGAYEGFQPFVLKISMESKGMFSSGVHYSVSEKNIYTRFSDPVPPSYREKCGADE